MARNGKRRRRNRSSTAKLQRQYRYRSKITEEMLQGERYRESQSEYMKVFHRKLNEAAETTVFITSVEDLTVPGNLAALREFLARAYGPIAFCRKHHYDGRNRTRFPFPPALVRFRRAQDAARVLSVDSLLRADDRAIRINCPVGHRGSILVRRYRHVNEVAQEEMTSSVIDFSSRGLSFGHWYPARKEYDGREEGRAAWLDVVTATAESTDPNEDVEVFNALPELLSLMFQGKRPLNKSNAERNPVSPTVQIDLVKREVRIIHQFGASKEFISFRFKQLESPMRLCRDENGSVSMVFSLKYPPKLDREEIVLPNFDTQNVRQISWAAVERETFGLCLGYKISLEDTTVMALQQHIKYRDLKGFGVLDLDFFQDFESRIVGWPQEHLWADMVASVRNVRLSK